MAFGIRRPEFAFLVHPRSSSEMARDPMLAFLRRSSRDDADFLKRCESIAPMCLGDISVGCSHCRGELICVARLPRRMFGAEGRAAVISAAKAAVSRGARVVGLGALTAPIMKGGEALVDHLSGDVTVTNGNAFTAAVVRANVHEARQKAGLPENACVAVVGCTGSVGAVLCRLLADDGLKVILIARSVERAQNALPDLLDVARVGEGLGAARDADIVVLVTGDPSARLHPEHVAPGALVIDVAQPQNIPFEDYPRFASHGVAVSPGGKVRIPRYSCGFCFSDCGLDEAFACLAEAYLFARSGIREHSIGIPTTAMARRLARLAEGYRIAPSKLSFYAVEDP